MPIANPELQSNLNLSSKDKFILILNLPKIMKAKYPNLAEEPLTLSLFGTVVPDISVPEVDLRFQGQNLHISTYARPNYPPLNVQFVVDNQYKNYYTLWKWLDIMNLALDDYYGGSSKDDIISTHNEDQQEYQTTFSVWGLNEYNKPVIEFNYYKAFISKLGGITYSYRDGGIIEANAEFHYSQLAVERLN